MPKITPHKMRGNYSVSDDWCPGCGLYAHVHLGLHRDDCTRGRKYRAGDAPPLHDGSDTSAHHNP